MYEFLVKKAKSLSDAKRLLKEEEAQILGGGQTLVPALKQRLASPSSLVSISCLKELKGIYKNQSNELVVGGGVTHAEVAKTGKDYSALAYLAGNIGDPAVRYRGTIGGSVANNDPSACYPAAVLGSGAIVVTSKREIHADEFFLGMFSTVLDENEIIIQVRFPIPMCANYQKFDQPASRFALVGVFMAKYDQNVRLAVTGASEDGVFRWMEAEEKLSTSFDPKILDQVALSCTDFISDMHGSAEYRCHLIKVLSKRAIIACINQGLA